MSRIGYSSSLCLLLLLRQAKRHVYAHTDEQSPSGGTGEHSRSHLNIHESLDVNVTAPWVTRRECKCFKKNVNRSRCSIFVKICTFNKAKGFFLVFLLQTYIHVMKWSNLNYTREKRGKFLKKMLYVHVGTWTSVLTRNSTQNSSFLVTSHLSPTFNKKSVSSYLVYIRELKIIDFFGFNWNATPNGLHLKTGLREIR